MIGRSLVNCTELWEPILKGFPNVTLNKIPALMKPIETIDMDQLRNKLSELGREDMAWKGDKQISWLAMMGTFIIIAIGGVGSMED